MGKLPAMMFYPRDWLIDPELSRCTCAARGVLMDTLCYMWESEIRGALVTRGKAWTKDELALAIRGDQKQVLSCINELLSIGVLHITGKSTVTLRYGIQRTVFATLPPSTIYSKRLVRDEIARTSARKRQKLFRDKYNSDITANITANITPVSQRSSYSYTEPPNFTLSQDTKSDVPVRKKGWIDVDEERRKRTREALGNFPDSETLAPNPPGDVHKDPSK